MIPDHYGTFAIIETYFDLLTRQGPWHIYHSEQSKSILIVYLDNPEARNFFASVTGLRCARARVILGVKSRTTSWRAIGWESVRWRGRRTLARSEKCGKISQGELRRSGMHDPIGVDISTTRHLGHGGCVYGSGEDYPGGGMPRILSRKTKPLSPIVGVLSTMLVNKSG